MATLQYGSPPIAVFNPRTSLMLVPTVEINSFGQRVSSLVAIPPNTWRMVTDSPEARAFVSANKLYIGGNLLPNSGSTNELPNGGTGTMEHHEDCITVTVAHLTRGFFETELLAVPKFFDSTEFVPEGAPQQIYDLDYTCVNVPGLNTTRVIFNKTVLLGPKSGITQLAVGDVVSFRYLTIV